MYLHAPPSHLFSLSLSLSLSPIDFWFLCTFIVSSHILNSAISLPKRRWDTLCRQYRKRAGREREIKREREGGRGKELEREKCGEIVYLINHRRKRAQLGRDLSAADRK